MASNPTVKLTFAGDAASLEKAAAASVAAMNKVDESAAIASEKMYKVDQSALAASRGFREAAASSLLLNNLLPPMAQKVSLLAVAGGDLSKAFINLKPKILEITDSVGGMGKAFGLATIAVGLAYAGWELGTAAGNKLNDMLGRSMSVGEQWARDVDDWTNAIKGYAEALGLATDNAVNLTKAQTELDFHAETSPGANDFLQGPVPLDATGHLLNSTNGGNTYAATTAAADAAKKAAAAIRTGGHSVGTAIKSAADEAKAAAQAAAAALKSAQGTVAQAVRGIADAFKPQLNLTSTPGLEVGGAGKSGGLIANLKKQADDTLKLRKDLEKLDKMGLDKGLLTSLVAGGLDSLPAAEELLKGGKAEIGQANYYAGRINVRGNTIATEQTARSLSKKDKQQLEINVKGGDAELVALLRKWVKNNGGYVQGVLGSN